ncbi:MAG TPA: serine hydrolase domain-containing protein [Polyangiaceae bacterium]|nr:serine hydrolase domain-containing protein [Polyangiaceae bacterium]
MIAVAGASVAVACASRTNTADSSAAKTTPAPEIHSSAPLEPIVELPRSPLGQLARLLVEAINSGKVAEQREFARTHFSEKALRDTSLEDWTTFLERTWQLSGGIDIIGVLPSRGPNQIGFAVRARKGRHYSSFGLAAANADGARIDGLFANPKFDPAIMRAGALTPIAMSEADAARAISERVEQLAAADRFSGAVLVVKGDRVLVSTAQGQADKAFAVPNRIDTKFNLGSMNKMFTAVSVGQLVEKGKMSFSDPLAKVLPDYPNRAFAESVTIHQLLTHTSGIGGDIFAPQVFEHRERFKRPSEYLPLFAKEPVEFPPGERFSYANSGFVVLGAVVERVSGEDYYSYVRAHLFEPAKMRDTDSFEIDELVPNLAVGYRADDNDAFGVLPRRSNVMAIPFKGTPAGGGFATVPDLCAFSEALRSHKLLGAAMTEMVTSAKVDMPGPPGTRYGYGFTTRIVRGKEVRGHSGGAAGINAALLIFWDGSYTVAVMGNYSPPAASGLAEEIVEFLAVQG